MATKRPRRESRRQAAAAGRRKFLTKRDCKSCGSRLRYTSNGGCVPCGRARSQESHEAIQRMLSEADA